ncbi:AAA family ATPase [Methylomarinum vadi]|uniref:AAA family ATPase n=1 Tax=Methylomarinum vadi TaxID=438855 RepID=UPI0006909968|nr:AAA family ATPase [Methylomarinum vadi]
MNALTEGTGSKVCWFVGASYGGTKDQTDRFVDKGVWENGYGNKYLDLVQSIKPGERIAIKSTYTRKHNLPFDNRGHVASVMAIKAIGIVTKNHGDGRVVEVDWTKFEEPREWYFYTYRSTVWRVLPDDWCAAGLISFTFDGQPQDIDRFRNDPYWYERFGDAPDEKKRFLWTKFYMEVADKLLDYRDRRSELVAALRKIAGRVEGLTNLHDRYKNGNVASLQDICPFTTMGIFNRGITEANRKVIASELAKFLKVEEPVPESFEGIPVLNNLKSWFFGFEKNREPDDIDSLWRIFAEALRFSDSEHSGDGSAFIDAYDNVTDRYGIGSNITMGLYWIRPWSFPTLDSRSKNYIEKNLGIKIDLNGPKGNCNALDYLSLLNKLEVHFQEPTYPVHSFPELSLAAWSYQDAEKLDEKQEDLPDQINESDNIADYEPVPVVVEPYGIDDILSDGCFLERLQLETILERLRTKKNLVLQGPPGTGKTWLAKRLAYALMTQKNVGNRLRVVQFHPNLCYEDFVRGWRPSGEGRLSLIDGPFMEMVQAAAKAPKVKHVIVIEEINRGNPAQIFGEMLTLLEADKRTPTEGLELCYRREDDERVFVPDNLYVIGTMNIADRSLALVDLALRRRFAFVDLQPTLGQPWREWVHQKFAIALEVLDEIESRMAALNEDIASDASLGKQFQVGHSYVTPPTGARINDAREWFKQIVQTEIGPLLEEYWFDANDKADNAKQRLLDGF